MREEVKQIQRMLEEQVYIADAAIATALYLSMALGKPLLIEGPAGVGKTEIAKALAIGTPSGFRAFRFGVRFLHDMLRLLSGEL